MAPALQRAHVARSGPRPAAPRALASACRRALVALQRVQPAAASKGDGGGEISTWEGVAGNVGTVATFAALLGYVAFVSPNQAPVRDTYLIQQLVGLLSEANGLRMNTILFDVFYLMGVYPCIFASLLVPSARSASKVPAWPFIALSFGAGIFGLLPYFCLWQPRSDKIAPPSASELDSSQGFGRFGLQATESVWLPAVLMLSAGGLLTSALTAGISEWNGYIQYFDESRFVHVMSLDFLALTLSAPFFMSWDAQMRGWEQRGVGVPVLSLLPLVGPCVYLMLRPKGFVPADDDAAV